MSTILELVESGNEIERIRELLREGVNPNTQDDSGSTPLHIAAMKNERNPQDTEALLLVVRELINFGANVNQQDEMGHTPLHLATIYRNYKIMDMLLQANAEVNRKNYLQWSALHYAVVKNLIYLFNTPTRHISYDMDLQILRLLLRYNPNIDIRNRRDETSLMLAVRENSLCIVQELLKKKASVNLKNALGETAVFYVLRLREVNVNILLELTRHGCSLREPNNEGEGPKDFYYRRLLSIIPPLPMENIKYVLKLFILDHIYLNFYQRHRISDVCGNGNRELVRFVEFCRSENRKMQLDILAPNYSMYDIAFRGAFRTDAQNNDNPIPLEVSDMVVEKLLTRQYPAYCDIIASGLCSSYMSTKFSEMCCGIKIFNQCLNPVVLDTLSFYLSHFDMLNFIHAYFKS